jgi:hypothetical protein
MDPHEILRLVQSELIECNAIKQPKMQYGCTTTYNCSTPWHWARCTIAVAAICNSCLLSHLLWCRRTSIHVTHDTSLSCLSRCSYYLPGITTTCPKQGSVPYTSLTSKFLVSRLHLYNTRCSYYLSITTTPLSKQGSVLYTCLTPNFLVPPASTEVAL